MPKTNYNEAAFWEEKYKITCCEPYEWICKPEDVFKELSHHLDYSSMNKVLQLGSGTSSLSKKLKIQTDARQKEVKFTCVDFSKQLIKMCKKNKVSLQSAAFICTDIRDLKPLYSQQFDYIFDKGCLDCVFCFDNFIKQVLKSLIECYKVLKVGGKLIILSHGKPKHRIYLLKNKLVPFHVEFQILPKTRGRQTEVYVYICTKQECDNQKQEGNLQNDDQKQDNQKKQERNKAEQEKEKDEQDAFFVLQQNKKSRKIKQNNQAQFILINESPKKILKNSDQAKFILDDDEQKNEQEDQEQIKAEAMENQKSIKIKQQELKYKKTQKQDQVPFILKQTQYQNDFDQI